MGPTEMIIVGIIAVLLFGRKLPEVARSLGTSYREFRKGLNELQSQVNTREIYNSVTATPSYKSYSETTSKSTAEGSDVDDHGEPTAPKFEPPPAEPQASANAAPGESTPSDEIDKKIAER
jgi:sec-independent protein translocase protein TatA